jgi:large subunit ribosomal protein L35
VPVESTVIPVKKRIVLVRFFASFAYKPGRQTSSVDDRRSPGPGCIKRSIHMPKMKTKKSAAKRFRVRPGGTVKRGQAFKRHILTKKTTKNKRHLRGAVNVHETNMGHMAQMLPFAGL